jgi:mono/diheme cytochrome c family protein
MKPRFLVLLAVVALLAVAWQAAAAQGADPGVVRGAMLYDNWSAVLGSDSPAGNMPIWSRQTTNTHSGADTWRCVTCHGWDYQGKDGAYRSGSNATGFPGVYAAAQNLSEAEIAAALKGKNDPEHDFSTYMNDAAISDLAKFIKSALIDDSKYIDPQALSVIGGDAAQGKMLFADQCASCHGADGAKIQFRFEGRDATLGTIAIIDPWRFLHKTRYGTPGTEMVIGATLGWTEQEGRDVLLYAQSLPSGLEPAEQGQSRSSSDELPQSPAGQSGNFFVGLLTAFGAMVTSLGFALFLGVFLIGVIFLIVWALRERRK